jgi:DNA repair exonuclease SbcCD ATPase subunit
MIIFKKISTRNLLSYGNVPTVLELNARKNTLIVGQNGSGKCVEKSSRIAVLVYPDNEYDEMTIGEIYGHFQEKTGKTFHVLTRFGYKEILACQITAKNSEVYEIKTADGYSLKTSPEHLMLSQYGWYKTNQLKPGDHLFTHQGSTIIDSITKQDYTEDLYDIEVDEVHEYFANGLISHNSTLTTDALCFALYGKPYRNISKGQLVNSINQKQLEVELDFSIGPIEYRVKRGIKPNVFEIYQDGKLVDQEAAVKDYQAYLERNILKINYKTFCQVVVLGTASFVPFMNLSTSQRRDVIEDVLDIAIFSNMNTVLKNRIAETNDELKTIGLKIESAKKETLAQKKLIQVIEDAKQNRIQEEMANVNQLFVTVEELTTRVDTKKQELEGLVKPEPVDADILRGITKKVDNLTYEKQTNTNTLNKIHRLDDCPTCLQRVSGEHKGNIKAEIDSKNEKLQKEILKQKELLEALEQKQTIINEYNNQVSIINLELTKLYDKISIHESEINKKQRLIQNIQNDVTDINKEKQKLKEIADGALVLLEKKSELMDEKTIQEISQSLLKDGGIKSAIIREYIPILNKLINKYLGMFGFYINFILDEGFNETIKSRGRDEFSYSSFSEGEKRKIDTAILFAFRQVSEMKNSANCNLLVLDEVGSENFDLNAKECFLEILSSIDGGNNFVISHSAPSHEAYDCVYKVEKRGDFSYMEPMT